jgi:hypothetical protein
MTAREWLRANGYAHVADTIDQILAEWRAAGNKQRRNWWQVLAGRKDGTSVLVAGRTFPVLAAAQKRQCVKVSRNAIRNKRGEKAPPIRLSRRWPQSGLF